MRKSAVWVGLVVLPGFGGLAGSPQNSFFDSLQELAQQARGKGRAFVEGEQGWLFLAGELEALGEQARSPDEVEDVLEAVVDFHRQLKAARVDLLLVPVPLKAALYAEKLAGGAAKEGGVRLDAGLKALYQRLEAQGVEVVDLMPPFLEQRKDRADPLYCRSDTHWSGRGIELAAAVLAERVRKRAWANSLSPKKYFQETMRIPIRGDLERLARPEAPGEEILQLRLVRDAAGNPPAIDRHSPVLLMGDSHCLVFHDPALHASGAGLPDHLAARMGFPVDLLAVRGSGANATRLSLRRRGDGLAGKRMVIWCLAARELVLSEWKKIGVTQRRRGAEPRADLTQSRQAAKCRKERACELHDAALTVHTRPTRWQAPALALPLDFPPKPRNGAKAWSLGCQPQEWPVKQVEPRRGGAVAGSSQPPDESG